MACSRQGANHSVSPISTAQTAAFAGISPDNLINSCCSGRQTASQSVLKSSLSVNVACDKADNSKQIASSTNHSSICSIGGGGASRRDFITTITSTHPLSLFCSSSCFTSSLHHHHLLLRYKRSTLKHQQQLVRLLSAPVQAERHSENERVSYILSAAATARAALQNVHHIDCDPPLPRSTWSLC